MTRLLTGTRPAGVVRTGAHSILEADDDYDLLLDRIGDSHFVLLGEASHGTHDFYFERAQITRRLIEEKGFTAVAAEADWPDAYRVNQFVRDRSDDRDADDALGGFRRFPTWMWRNVVMLEFVTWLRDHNDALPAHAPHAGFYGIDLYSLYASMEAVVGYLDKVDPEAARKAKARYACFDHYGENSEAYGFSTTYRLAPSCEKEVIAQLIDLQQQRVDYLRRDGRIAEEDYFFAEQNARLVKNAERYYREMFGSRVSSWNLRDQHMAETLEALARHLSESGAPAKIVVWAHNSHLGDARATELGEGGELNVGQLVRQKHGADAFLIGFTTYTGTVTAASDWGEPAERKRVRPALAGSYESLFHEADRNRYYLLLRGDRELSKALAADRLERAIGVVYRPQTERQSHYFHARLSDQFDAVIHLDETRALEPLERTEPWVAGEAPETFPTGV